MSHVPTYISVTLQFLHHCPKNRKQIKKFLGNVGHAQQNKTDYCFCLDMRKFHSKELFVRPQIDSIFFCPSWPYVSFYLVCISGIVGVFHVFNPLQFIIVCRSKITRIFTSISITYTLIAQIDECQMSSGIIYWIACWKKICLNLEFIGIFNLKYISCLSQITSVALIMGCKSLSNFRK